MSAATRWSALSPQFLGILRFVAGAIFALHGAQKVLGWFEPMPPGVPAYIKWGAGGMELVGGILIALGLLTRISAFLCSGEMAVAYFKGHAMTATGINFFLPNVNGGELAVLYCFIFLYLSARGPGAFAIDNLLGSRRAP